MKYRVQHKTVYHYTERVSLCHNEIHLAPRNYTQQTCHYSHLRISPQPTGAGRAGAIFLGNTAASFGIQERHTKLEIVADSKVEVLAANTPAASLTPAWEDVREMLSGFDAPRHLDATQFLHESHYVRYNDEIAAYARISFPHGRPILEGALDLTRRNSYGVHLRSESDDDLHVRLNNFSNCAAESARTSPICRSPACARWVWPRATSAAIY